MATQIQKAHRLCQWARRGEWTRVSEKLHLNPEDSKKQISAIKLRALRSIQDMVALIDADTEKKKAMKPPEFRNFTKIRMFLRTMTTQLEHVVPLPDRFSLEQRLRAEEVHCESKLSASMFMMGSSSSGRSSGDSDREASGEIQCHDCWRNVAEDIHYQCLQCAIILCVECEAESPQYHDPQHVFAKLRPLNKE